MSPELSHDLMEHIGRRLELRHRGLQLHRRIILLTGPAQPLRQLDLHERYGQRLEHVLVDRTGEPSVQLRDRRCVPAHRWGLLGRRARGEPRAHPYHRAATASDLESAR